MAHSVSRQRMTGICALRLSRLWRLRSELGAFAGDPCRLGVCPLQTFSTTCGIRRSRSGKVAIQRRARHPETVGNIADGIIGIGEQRPRNVEVVLGQLRRSASCSARTLRYGKSGACTLPNEGALEFGKLAEHVKHQDALRRRPVDRLREAPKANVAQAQLLDRLDELLHGSRQAVELPAYQPVDEVPVFGLRSARR